MKNRRRLAPVNRDRDADARARALIFARHMEAIRLERPVPPALAQASVVLSANRVKLIHLKRERARIDRKLTADFRDFAMGAGKIVYNLRTHEKWRKLNVAIAKLEFVILPLERAGMPVPHNLPAPRSYWRIESMHEWMRAPNDLPSAMGR